MFTVGQPWPYFDAIQRAKQNIKLTNGHSFWLIYIFDYAKYLRFTMLNWVINILLIDNFNFTHFIIVIERLSFCLSVPSYQICSFAWWHTIISYCDDDVCGLTLLSVFRSRVSCFHSCLC